LLQHLLKLTNARFAEGKAKLQDVLKAQSQLAQLGYDLVLLRELENVETAKLAALLDVPTSTIFGDTGMPPLNVVELSVEELEEAALAQRQELAIAGAMAEKRREAVRLAKLKNRPKFTLSAMRIETGEAAMPVSESGKDPWLVGVGVSIPLWLGRNRSRVRQAELMETAAAARERALENDTRAELKSVYFRLENARRLVELYEKSLIPQAEQAMEVAEQWHDGAVQDVSGFLETQSVWLNFNLARLRAATDYQQYLARLERLVGGSLPRAQTGKEDAE
jgi:outer membrane protein TolC